MGNMGRPIRPSWLGLHFSWLVPRPLFATAMPGMNFVSARHCRARPNALSLLEMTLAKSPADVVRDVRETSRKEQLTNDEGTTYMKSGQVPGAPRRLPLRLPVRCYIAGACGKPVSGRRRRLGRERCSRRCNAIAECWCAGHAGESP